MSQQTSYVLFTLRLIWRRFFHPPFSLAALSRTQKQQSDWQTGDRRTQSIWGSCFSQQLFHMAMRDPRSSWKDGSALQCVCLGFKHYEDRKKISKFLMSPGIEWFLCHKKCEALYPTYTHTIESNIASSPVGTGR